MKKLIFLFLALLFPITIFIFLKEFGDNEFSVPVYHEEGAVVPPTDCNFSYEAPYRVADTVMADLGMNAADSLCVVYFGDALETAMNRVTTEFRGKPVRSVAVSRVPGMDEGFLKRCVFLMEEKTSIVLVDQHLRIRGYYNGSDRDEVDRLIVEMKIILKQY